MTDRSFMEYIKDMLSFDEVAFRAMMGEYILYCRARVVGGLYDDRLLVKITPSSTALLKDAPRVVPYPGAKEMFLVENTDDGEFLGKVLQSIAADLADKKRK